MKSTSSNVSIIIPSFNAIKTIGDCLDALTHQTLSPHEIIVVDSSDDKTADFIRANYPEVNLLIQEEKIFPGPARNIGARKSSGDILAFIDADCIAVPTWIEQIVTRHREGHKIVGGSISVGDPTNVFAWCGHFMEFREYLQSGQVRFVSHIPSCNISYSKDVFLDTGGFPESYYPQEDLLLDYLLMLEGQKILFDPAILIRHFCRDSLPDYLSHQHRIGRVTCCVLKRLSLDGAFVARNLWLTRLISPFLGLIKFVKTSAVAAGRYPQTVLKKPVMIPLLFLGAVWWARGFAAGGEGGLKGIIGWEDPLEPIFVRITTKNNNLPKE